MLYVAWEKVPGPWTLSYGDKSVSCGQNGFLHEFVGVEGGAKEVTLTVQEEESICFVRAFGPSSIGSVYPMRASTVSRTLAFTVPR